MVGKMDQKGLASLVALVAQREANRGLADIDKDLSEAQKIAIALPNNSWRRWQY